MKSPNTTSDCGRVDGIESASKKGPSKKRSNKKSTNTKNGSKSKGIAKSSYAKQRLNFPAKRSSLPPPDKVAYNLRSSQQSTSLPRSEGGVDELESGHEDTPDIPGPPAKARDLSDMPAELLQMICAQLMATSEIIVGDLSTQQLGVVPAWLSVNRAWRSKTLDYFFKRTVFSVAVSLGNIKGFTTTSLRWRWEAMGVCRELIQGVVVSFYGYTRPSLYALGDVVHFIATEEFFRNSIHDTNG